MKVVFDINMDAEEFRKFGYAAIDFVADYLENIRERLVYFEPIKSVCDRSQSEMEFYSWNYSK